MILKYCFKKICTFAFEPEFTADAFQSIISRLRKTVASLTLQVNKLSDEVER